MNWGSGRGTNLLPLFYFPPSFVCLQKSPQTNSQVTFGTFNGPAPSFCKPALKLRAILCLRIYKTPIFGKMSSFFPTPAKPRIYQTFHHPLLLIENPAENKSHVRSQRHPQGWRQCIFLPASIKHSRDLEKNLQNNNNKKCLVFLELGVSKAVLLHASRGQS